MACIAAWPGGSLPARQCTCQCTSPAKTLLWRTPLQGPPPPPPQHHYMPPPPGAVNSAGPPPGGPPYPGGGAYPPPPMMHSRSSMGPAIPPPPPGYGRHGPAPAPQRSHSQSSRHQAPPAQQVGLRDAWISRCALLRGSPCGGNGGSTCTPRLVLGTMQMPFLSPNPSNNIKYAVLV